MKKFLPTFMLVILATACAHTQNAAVTTTKIDPVPSAETAPFAPKLQVPLPYTFIRRGVEIRVNSVEFANDKLQVSLSLHESKARPVDILASTLMEARISPTQILSYAGYNRAGQMQTSPDLHLAADEKFSIDVFYALPAAVEPGTPVQIQFTTGKWWSSEG